jgi:transaldolase
MRLYVDTADLATVREALELGVIDGVTTNPTILARAGSDLKQTMRGLVELVEGEVWCQAVSADAAGMVAEGREIRSWGEHMVVKLPMSLPGLQAASQLSTEGVTVNMTLVYSVPQALLAAKAGASWISPYAGRVDDTGASGADLVGAMVQALNVQGLATRVLVASVRGPRHISELAAHGVGGFTMPYSVLLDLAANPLTDRDLERFNTDWEEAGGHAGWAPVTPRP